MLWLQIKCHVLGDTMMALKLLAIKCRNRMNEPLLACNITVSTLFLNLNVACYFIRSNSVASVPASIS